MWEIVKAGGLAVAIPSFIAYRYLRGKVERIVVDMEKIAVKFADSLGAVQQSEDNPGTASGIARQA
jgi:biopolymer transport protein ExbB/TolQ